MDLLILLVCVIVAAAADVNINENNFEYYLDSRRLNMNRKYRPYYHITAPIGWLNDPAGFIMYNHQYHVFYQYHPYNGAWGHISWGHAVSDNLIDWVHYPPALVPKEFYEKHGCLSGTAVVQNNYLTLFYTGTFNLNNKTRQNQNIAISSDGIIFQKYLYNPIIKESPHWMSSGVGEIRNPKVWKYRNKWYMIVGAMSNMRQAQLFLYTSNDMFHWKQDGIIAQSYGDMGYMWESPDLFEINGQSILILSVRGMQNDGYRFRNLYNNGYVIGNFNYRTGHLEETEISASTFNELDHGHDFYAAQTTQALDGRRILIAWLGMWESSFEESRDGWASMLTIARELDLVNDVLYMRPVRELIELRSEILEDAWYTPGEAFSAGCKSFELHVNSSIGATNAVIGFEWKVRGSEQQYLISYNAAYGSVTVDRGGDDGIRRADWSPENDRVSWQIFVDQSSVEVFCGQGEVVFSSRIYPRKSMQIRVSGDTQLHIVQYRLRRSVSFDERLRRKVRLAERNR